MFTPISAMALLAALSSIPEVPVFKTDYRLACLATASEKKPMAVFLGKGADGWKKGVRGGTIDPAVGRMLASKYVCTFIDTDTAEGQRLAKAFELNGTTGLVVSDRSGGLVAFRHDGELPADELTRRLTRYAEPEYVVRTTEKVAAPAGMYSAPAGYAPGCATGGCCAGGCCGGHRRR